MEKIEIHLNGEIMSISTPDGDNVKKKVFNLCNGAPFYVSRFSRGPGNHPHEDEHTHNFLELVYTADGECMHYINGKAFKVLRGDLLFINYGETHSFDALTHMEAYNFLLKPEFISENLIDSENVNDIFLALLPESAEELQSSKTSCVHFSGSDRMEIERSLDAIISELKDNKQCVSLVVNAYVRLIFAKLIRQLLQNTGDRRPNIFTDELLKYLDENFTTPITLESIAEHCFYNPAYLGRVFKAVHGKSIKDYIRVKRMEYAMQLLCETDLPIEEIYARVGYCGKAQFYKNFKEYYGETPRKFRSR
jgi:AraC-like DNA-binding protein